MLRSIAIFVLDLLLILVMRSDTRRFKTKVRTAWWREYNAFLRSAHWDHVRRRVLARDGYRCRYCNAKAVQVHHTSYAQGLDNPQALESVCLACHARLHCL